MKIRIPNRTISRRYAYDVVLNHIICQICHQGDQEMLADILMTGWVAIESWSNQDLQEYVDSLVENDEYDFSKHISHEHLCKGQL